MKDLTRFLTLSSLIIMTGCNTNPVKRDPDYAAVRPVATEGQEKMMVLFLMLAPIFHYSKIIELVVLAIF